jgi:hypothetical protein
MLSGHHPETTDPEEKLMGKSWKPEVIADASGEWVGNALRFATKEEAYENARDLSYRWILVRDFRAVESDDPVNYRYIDHRLVPVEEEVV